MELEVRGRCDQGRGIRKWAVLANGARITLELAFIWDCTLGAHIGALTG